MQDKVAETAITEMTITQGMKEIKLIRKKIEVNCGRITEFSSLLSNEKCHFKTEEEQKQAVISLVQANMDLCRRALDINNAINYTNIVTLVDFETRPYRINELLQLKRTYSALKSQTFKSMNDSNAINNRRHVTSDTVNVVRFYDTEKRNKLIDDQDTFYSRITGRLEAVNAVTLLKVPE